jgi:hypothetical protein
VRIPVDLECYRVREGRLATLPGQRSGLFLLPGPHARTLTVVADPGSDRDGICWDHVSVSIPKRTPSWAEMDYVKRCFWDDAETVMQLHPPRAQWINHHPHCLHLWRPWGPGETIPLPPLIAV